MIKAQFHWHVMMSQFVNRSQRSSRPANRSSRSKGAAELSRKALAASSVGTWEWDIARDTVICSAVTAALFGVPETALADGIPLRRFEAAIHPDDQPRFQSLLEQSCRDGGLFVAEYRTIPHPEQICWVIARGSFELDESGVALFGRGIVIDITSARDDALRHDASYFFRQPVEVSLVLDTVSEQALELWETAQMLEPESLGRVLPLLQSLLLEIGRQLAKALDRAATGSDSIKKVDLH